MTVQQFPKGPEGQSPRQQWMGILSRADAASLRDLIAALPGIPEYDLIRQPESGAVMVRGRAGGDGQPFNLGEMTVTRCAIRLRDQGTAGFGYVQGRSHAHARDAALADALLQLDDWHDLVEAEIIRPLERAHLGKREARSRKAASTRVDFFTMVRGENLK